MYQSRMIYTIKRSVRLTGKEIHHDGSRYINFEKEEEKKKETLS